MTALFIIAIGVFGYLCYVLVKPENFRKVKCGCVKSETVSP
ncbi:MAG: potassium-transporting ATPase subunit F [Saprospiraceae bacterium]|nr:potassium-transporting ATPase subunit F [Saprospiraceae bacterium]